MEGGRGVGLGLGGGRDNNIGTWRDSQSEGTLYNALCAVHSSGGGLGLMNLVFKFGISCPAHIHVGKGETFLAKKGQRNPQLNLQPSEE